MFSEHARNILCLLVTLLWWAGLNAQHSDTVALAYRVALTANAGDSPFAPHYIMTGRGGTVTQQRSLLVSAELGHEMDTTRRVSWGFGAELWAGAATAVGYDRYDAETGSWSSKDRRPAAAWVQQLYAEGKYRSVFLTVGQKDIDPEFVSRDLSSGDLVMSGNARAPYGLRAGLIDYRPVPFMRGHLLVRGEYGYYRMGDSQWLENHYNYYNSFLCTGYWFNYKNIHFLIPAGRRWSVTVGAQASCQLAGTCNYYINGEIVQTVKMEADARAFWHALIPGSGNSDTGDRYVEGNHVGSWDLAVEHRLNDHATLRAYCQAPWEDGSGLGKLNGWDGLWGVEYRRDGRAPVTGAVVEFIDFMNQSGPLHFAPKDFIDDDHPQGSEIASNATGSDDYYNNYCYNGYQNRGMAIGSPMVQGVIYNTDGYLRFTDNRLRGFHLAVKGFVTSTLAYRAMFSLRRSFGTTFIPRIAPRSGTAMMLEAVYRPATRCRGLEIKAQIAHDHGSLLGGNNTGALVTVAYNGNFSLK